MLFRILIRWRWTVKFTGLVERFGMLGMIWVSLVGENIQYFSFRCFSQLYELKSDEKMLFNIVVTYVVLFVIVFYAVASHLMLPHYSKCGRLLL